MQFIQVLKNCYEGYLHFFTGSFTESHPDIIPKARLLVLLTTILAFFTIFVLFWSRGPVTYYIVLAVLLFLLVTLFLLKAGQYYLAFQIMMGTMITSSFLGQLSRGTIFNYELYIVAFFIIFVLVIARITTVKGSMLLPLFIEAVLILNLEYFVRVLPAQNYTLLNFDDWIISMTIIVLSSISLYIDHKQSINLLNRAREREAAFQTIFDESPAIMIIQDQERMYSDANRAFLDFIGKEKEELIGKSPELSHMISEDEVNRLTQEYQQWGSLKDSYFVASDRNNLPHTFNIKTRNLNLQGKPYTLSILNDVTAMLQTQDMLEKLNHELLREVDERTAALKQSMEELKMAQDQLIEAEKMASLGGLVAGISHEVNNPLGIAITAVTHLEILVSKIQSLCDASATQRDKDRLIQQINESTAILFRNLKRAADLVRNFKEIAADQIQDHKRKVILKNHIDEALMALSPQLRHRNVAIRTDIPEGLTMETLPGALWQVITNLVLNSLTHAFPENNKGKIEIQAECIGKTVVIKYSDDGEGMPEDVRKKAFEPFFTTRRGSGGSGLGLYIVYKIVTQDLEGKILLDSKPGEGCHFEITLPA